MEAALKNKIKLHTSMIMIRNCFFFRSFFDFFFNFLKDNQTMQTTNWMIEPLPQ